MAGDHKSSILVPLLGTLHSVDALFILCQNLRHTTPHSSSQNDTICTRPQGCPECSLQHIAQTTNHTFSPLIASWRANPYISYIPQYSWTNSTNQSKEHTDASTSKYSPYQQYRILLRPRVAYTVAATCRCPASQENDQWCEKECPDMFFSCEGSAHNPTQESIAISMKYQVIYGIVVDMLSACFYSWKKVSGVFRKYLKTVLAICKLLQSLLNHLLHTSTGKLEFATTQNSLKGTICHSCEAPYTLVFESPFKHGMSSIS